MTKKLEILVSCLDKIDNTVRKNMKSESNDVFLVFVGNNHSMMKLGEIPSAHAHFDFNAPVAKPGCDRRPSPLWKSHPLLLLCPFAYCGLIDPS